MDLNANETHVQHQSQTQIEGGTTESWSWIRPWTWINTDRWSWMFKYGALYVVCIYTFLIIYQIIMPKESTIEKLKNMIDRDEKWAEVQSAYDRRSTDDRRSVHDQRSTHDSKPQMNPVDLAKTSWKTRLSESFEFFFDQLFNLFSYLNEVRIHLLGDIWNWLHEKVTDFIARRSARIH